MLDMIVFCLCSVGAILTAVNSNWGLFIMDVIFAAMSAKPAFEWLKSQQ